jgi:general secretion pathway protein L
VSEKLVIQLLEETWNVEKTPSDHLLDAPADLEADDAHAWASYRFRWGFTNDNCHWRSASHEGSGEEMLAWLSNESQPATLLLPGSKIVTFCVPYNKKESRYFSKLLPYQIEDDVLVPVDSLFFVAGRREAEVVTAAYADRLWLSNLFRWFRDNNLVIERTIADYQSLLAMGNELILWFTEEGTCWGHRSNGLGFTVTQALSNSFLQDLLLRQQDLQNPWSVKVFVEDSESEVLVKEQLMPAVDYDLVIGQPPVDLQQRNQLNFCHGQFGRQSPIAHWWHEAKPLAYLAAAAVMVFFAVTFVDIYSSNKEQGTILQARDEAYRSVIPRGPITDPVRRLRSMLGSDQAGEEETSYSLYLLSKVAPVVQKLNISLTMLSYSHREQIMRINVSAKSFAIIEQLSQELNQQGLSAELKNSSSVQDGYQGRLEVGLSTTLNRG